MASTVSPPSSGSAAAWSVSASPIAFHFSGSTTTSAPVETARATSLSAFSRFAAFSGPLVIWTQATRRRSDTASRIAFGHGGDHRRALPCARAAGLSQPRFPPALDRAGGLAARRHGLPRRPRLADLHAHGLGPLAGLRAHSPGHWAALYGIDRRRARRPLRPALDDAGLRPRAVRLDRRAHGDRRHGTPRPGDPPRARVRRRARHGLLHPRSRRPRAARGRRAWARLR